MKYLSALLLFAVLSSAGMAGSKSQSITVNVRGMVCAFCAQGISKKFTAIPEVESVKVNLDDKYVKLTVREGKTLPDEKIKEAITQSGFNVEKIVRDSL